MKGLILNSEGKAIANVEYDSITEGENVYIHKDNEVIAIVPKTFAFLKINEQKENI